MAKWPNFRQWIASDNRKYFTNVEYSVSEQNTISRFAETQPSVRPFFQYFARLLGRAVRPIIMPYRNGAADDAVRRRRAAFLTYLLEEKENG